MYYSGLADSPPSLYPFDPNMLPPAAPVVDAPPSGLPTGWSILPSTPYKFTDSVSIPAGNYRTPPEGTWGPPAPSPSKQPVSSPASKVSPDLFSWLNLPAYHTNIYAKPNQQNSYDYKPAILWLAVLGAVGVFFLLGNDKKKG